VGALAYSTQGERMGISNGRRGGIVATLLCVVLGLAVLAGVAVLYLARNVRVYDRSEDGRKEVFIESPAGKLRIFARERGNSGRVGVPIYPGATREHKAGQATFMWSPADGEPEKAVAFAGEALYTRDTAEQVLAWYRERLPGWTLVEDHGESTLEREEDGFKRLITIREKRDGTHIVVASAGAPASN